MTFADFANFSAADLSDFVSTLTNEELFQLLEELVPTFSADRMRRARKHGRIHGFDQLRLWIRMNGNQTVWA